MADVSKAVDIIFSAKGDAAAVTDSLAKSMAKVGESATLTAKQTEQAAAAEEKWSTSAIKAQQEAEKTAESLKKMGDSSEGAEKKADSLTTALKTLAASLVTKAFIDANVSFDQFNRAMTLITGSSKAAADEFKFISDLSNTLGINVKSAADSYVSLTAATKDTVLEGEETRKIFAAVANAMAVLGRSSADTQTALKAIEQMASKGKISMEELRGQLGDKLPGALKLAAAAMGIPIEEMDKFVKKGVEATVFLPKFADEINKTFAPDGLQRVAGYTQELARVQNAIAAIFVEVGKGGAMDALIKGLQLAGAAAVGATAWFKVLGEVFGAFFGAVAARDFSGFIDAVDAALQKGANSTRGASDALLGFDDSIKSVGTSAGKLSQSLGVDAIDKYADANKLAAEATNKASESSRLFVLNLADLKQPLAGMSDQILKAGDDSLTLGNALKSTAGSTDFLVGGVRKLVDGTKDIYAIYDATTGKLLGYENAQNKTGEALKKSTELTDKAKEAADKYQLKLEELASNERIKAMEFKVNLDIAQMQEDTKRIEASFESINEVISSTNDLMGDLFSTLASPNLDWSQIRAIEDQIAKENDIKKSQLELQRQLIEAQITKLNAEAQQILKGDALIKIEGAGLQPHLEAFMWEILKAIQVKVNRDGLPFLLGV